MRWNAYAAYEWHLWFAWRPILLGDSYVWFEWLERRKRCDGYDTYYNYRWRQE